MTSTDPVTSQSDAPDHTALTGARQQWLTICASLRKAPDRLAMLLTAEYPYAPIFVAGSGRWYDREPLVDEGLDVPGLSSAGAILAVARALADPADSASLLAPALAHFNRANVLPDDVTMSLPQEVFGSADPDLRGVLQRAEEIGGAAAGLAALLAIHLAGGELARGRSVEVPVLFERNRDGGRAVLRLCLASGGPSGLYPDPAEMLFLTSDSGFQRALTAAWQTSALRATRACVLWSIRSGADPCNDVLHDSLGAAFGAALDELRRSAARFGRFRLRRLHPRRAITGGLSPDRSVTPVGGLESKFAVAERSRWRVVVPKAQQAEADGLRERHPALRRGLYFAADLDEVLRNARWFDVRQMALGALVILLVLGGAGSAIGVNLYNRQSVQESEKLARAAELTSHASRIKQTDPRLAGLLALAAYRIAPSASGQTDALRDVLAANENVVRSWKASSSLVDAIAVDTLRSRVFTSGDDDAIKAWDLNTGAATGQTAGMTGRLVMNPDAPVLAAVNSDHIRLYDVGSGEPKLLGRLPQDYCGNANSRIIAADFVNGGGTVLAARDDGSVSTWDMVTRTADGCWRLRNAATKQQLGDVQPGRLVLDASVVPENASLDEEDHLLLLLNQNRVLDVGVRSHRIAVALNGTEVPADATRVRGTKDRLAVGTSAGVLLWDRTTRTSLAFPLAGLSAAVTALDYRNNRLVIASADGAAVVPDFADAQGTGRSSMTPRGGRIEAAAVGKNDAIVAAGPGGRIVILRDDSGALALPPLAPASTIAYTPNGDLLLDNWSAGRSSQLFTVRPTGAPEYQSPIGNTYAHLEDYNRSKVFYANESAASTDYVAAVGQIDNRTAAVIVWPAAGGGPRELEIPTPDDADRKPEEQIGADVAFAPDAGLILARHASGQVAIWDTRTWRRAEPLDLRPGAISMDVHGTQGVFTDGGEEQTDLVLIDLRTHQEIKRVPAPQSYRLAWSRDGRRIVSLRWGNELQMYDAMLNPIGEPWKLPEGSLGENIAISPDSTRLAVAQGPRVLVYDLASRSEAMPALVEPAGNRVVRPIWSPDGSTILALTLPPTRARIQPGPVRRWVVTDRDWTTQICRWVGGGLSQDEWRRNVGRDIKFIDLCRGVK